MASIIRVDQIETLTGNPVMSFDSAGKVSLFGSLKLPVWTNSTRPLSPEIGLIGYNSEAVVCEVYNGTEWVNIGSSGLAADPDAGGGFSIAQGADGASVTGFTTNSMVQYKSNDANQGASNASTALSYSSGCPGSAQFCYHTGHQVPGWWPMYHAIQVTSAEKGKVLNQCDWQTHVNAIGNVDFFGSNQSINASNFTNESLWSHIGRAHFGGSGGGSSDCTVYSRSFNPNNYGYKWYMIKGVDNQNSPVAYPGVGSQGGWAMYRLRLNKV